MSRLFVAFLVLLLLTGCGSTQQNQASLPETPPDGQQVGRAPASDAAVTQAREGLADLLGLKLGRQWQYQGEGNEYAAFTATVAHVKDNFYQIEENNGGTILARVIALQPDGAYEVLTKEEHTPGKSLLTDLNMPMDAASKLLPWPLTVGASWSQPSGGKAEVVATAQEHDVPFGELNQVTQVRISTTRRISETASNEAFDETSVVDRFYAQGVGLIEQRFTSGDFVVTSKLEKMTLIQK